MAWQVGLPLATGIAIACSALSAHHLHRLRRARPGDVDGMVRALRGTDRANVEARFASTLEDSSGRALVSAALAAGAEAWVGVVNERLSDAAHAIDDGSAVSRAAARICAASGTLIAVLGFASGGSAVGAPLGAFVAGLTGALVSLEFGRRGDRSRAELRADWDRLAAALARFLADPDCGQRRR